MKKTNNDNFVTIPRQTLNTLKSLLFSENGTDLSKIIDDLSFGKNDDLTAINVALTFKGLKPQIDPSARKDYNGSQLVFINYSLINDAVLAMDEKGESRVYSGEDWFNKPLFAPNE
jgi:F420-0:gamma-glutamyl ligase